MNKDTDKFSDKSEIIEEIEETEEMEVYTDEEAECIERHIEESFGKILSFFSEKKSDHVKININFIPPDKEHPFCTFVTSGMGAHVMNVPEELRDKHLERAELIICLPTSCGLDVEETPYKWALNLLSLIARLPIKENAWLGWGHTIDYGDCFTGEGDFCGVMMIYPMFEKESLTCTLPNGDTVNFYQVLLLKRNEIDFKNKNGASALISRLTDEQLSVTDLERESVVSDNFEDIIDTVKEHADKISANGFDIPDINGANHIAVFLRWLILHDMIDEEFIEFFGEDIERVKEGEYDARRFLINELGGELTKDILNIEGRLFCNFYYNRYSDSTERCYCTDVDKHALEYFGEEKYNCEEFNDEAYLFVPYDDNYYKAMGRMITDNYYDFIDFLSDLRPLDRYERHRCKIEEKKLDTFEINAANHIAAFLSWGIRHELMSESFMEFYKDFKSDIDRGLLDLRDFFIKNLDGELIPNMFSDLGKAFANYYYNQDSERSRLTTYTEDVDKYALEFFGEERYNSDEFQTEAYLFMPYNVNYQLMLSDYINEAFERFQIENVIDSCEKQAVRLREDGKKVPPLKNIAVYMVIFLMWCIEHKLMSRNFMKKYGDELEKINGDISEMTVFFRKRLKNKITNDIFCRKGIAFAHFYYSYDCPLPSYPGDLREVARKYFGDKKYEKTAETNGEAFFRFPQTNEELEEIVAEVNRCIARAYEDFLYFADTGKLPDTE